MLRRNRPRRVTPTRALLGAGRDPLLGPLQQRHMAQLRRDRLERRHQIAQHQIIGADLVWIAPAIDETRRFIEGRIDEVSCSLQLRRRLRALRRIGQVDRHMMGAVERARLAPRQGYDIGAASLAEVPQCGISDPSEGRRAGNL